MINCLNCGKENEYSNFCDGYCHINYTKDNGGEVYTPNNLPIRCIMANGLMLEVAGGDHPDYKFPVYVEYIGNEEHLGENPESHALIYTDGDVALTVYECCYAMWSAKTGKFWGGDLWDKDFKLSDGSLVKIIADNFEKLSLLK